MNMSIFQHLMYNYHCIKNSLEIQYWLFIIYQPEHENASLHLILQILENIKYNNIEFVE